MTAPRIGVLLGGLSSERRLSLESGQAVLSALLARGHDAHHVFVDRDLDLVLRHERIDIAFIALHGRYGEDGCVQGLLETIGIPYTGSDVLASALAMNKVRARQMFRFSNLPTPPCYTLPAEADADLVLARHGDFGFPVVVKPAAAGGSWCGVARAGDRDQLVAACRRAAGHDSELLVERYIEGQAISIGVLDGRPLGAVEIEVSRPLFDTAAPRNPSGADLNALHAGPPQGPKYDPAAATRYHTPPRLSTERLRGALQQAAMAHRALGCSGATRVDMIVSPTGNEYLLEVHTVPGLSRRSRLPRIAEAAGVSFEDLVELMLAGASCRGRRPRRPGVIAAAA